MYLKSFDYFRAIAILFVVFGHCLDKLLWRHDTIINKFVLNFIEGGTTNFVFISGFLFHHIFFKKFVYNDFLFKKVKGVLSPYLILSILPICYFVFVLKSGPYQEYFFSSNKGLYFEYIRPICLYLITGRTFLAYWYVPFIMVLFALSPLFVKYIELPPRSRIMIMSFMFMISVIIHRPINNISVLQSVVYFTPVYLLGIMASMHKEVVYEYILGKEFYLFLVALFLSVFQIVYYETDTNFHKSPFEITVVDINLIQKSVMCIFFMVWLHRFENKQFKYLDKLAEASFAIYFLHPPILVCLEKLSRYLHFHHHDTIVYILNALIVPEVLFISLVLAAIIKIIFRNNSRFIVGW